MKKLIIPFLTLTLIGSVALAANENAGQGQQAQTGQQIESESAQQGQQAGQAVEQQVQTQQQTQNQGEEQQIRTEQQVQTRENEAAGETIRMEVQQRARTVTEAKQMIQQRQQEMAQEITDLSGVQQKVYQNQNKVREAVHALLAIENLAGGIGSEVSAIAQEFNNSVQATIVAEEKIQKRNALVRFFVGGEKDAAEELEQELNQNQQRIQELKQLREACACGEEVKTLMQEQIQQMEQEQTRLQQLAEKEKNSNGMFGWFRNLFRWRR